MRELIYNFSRCRTVERGDAVLTEMRKKNPDVPITCETDAIRLRRRHSCGRITSQLVESVFGTSRPFREKGFVEGIIWLCNKFQTVQLEERKLLQRWPGSDYKGECVACLSLAASDKFYDLVHHQAGVLRSTPADRSPRWN